MLVGVCSAEARAPPFHGYAVFGRYWDVLVRPCGMCMKRFFTWCEVIIHMILGEYSKFVGNFVFADVP